jgi:hypothetical protein
VTTIQKIVYGLNRILKSNGIEEETIMKNTREHFNLSINELLQVNSEGKINSNIFQEYFEKRLTI